MARASSNDLAPNPHEIQGPPIRQAGFASSKHQQPLDQVLDSGDGGSHHVRHVPELGRG